MSGEADRTSIEEEVDTGKETAEKNLMKPKDPKVPWAKLRRVDSLNLEAGRVSMVAHDPYQVGTLPRCSFLYVS